jgi:hypothetical protein
MNEQLLLRLPHKQFVFTLPKVLRIFFRHDRKLYGEISRLIYRLVRDFATEAAGKPIRTAAVVVFQTSGSFCRWNPHWHSLFLSGGFDQEGRFVHVRTVDLAKMSGCFRQRVIAFFLERKLLNERLAKNMLDWTHSGFSVDDSIRIQAGSAKTREALAQYIVRPPVSLQNLLVDEGGTDTVVYRAPYSDYFKTDTKVFPPRRVSCRGPPAPTRFAAPTCTHLRPVFLSGSRHPSPGSSAIALREGSPASPTWSASLLRAGSATIPPNPPSASARPTSRSPSSPCPPSTAAPRGPA